MLYLKPFSENLLLYMAGVVGVEPTSTVLETAILTIGRYP